MALAPPQKQPTQKNTRVTSMRLRPPPTVKRVPEAQPPPSCMPRPKRKAPTVTETPTGAMKPPAGRPKRLPAAMIGRKQAVVRASMIIWARSPAPRPSAMKTRQAPVKPKLAW